MQPASAIQLHLVPAGRRLDFNVSPGNYAYVYRRCRNQEWQCVAHNACSPYLDKAPIEPSAAPEYMVHYRNADGTVTAATDVVRADPAGMPRTTSWINLA
ncbi:hypothetical protein [Hymenobacter latericus]|uniref:hypothetical protein n=1 Tax=Hymenobacter sp. YIM 151858-1 TaxID=2987688 RepID=UPI002225FF11|nr:hypothetical protein [Hymenobacter sp. YIM 151858-1]UYZ59542.1 hypothetical protein OIS50_01790 [Hymenobacter sp. YIM 151858-1]